MFLIFDVETTGFIKGDKIDFSKLDNFPRVVQLAFQLHDEKGKLIQQYSQIVKPDGFEIPYNAAQVHKITTERAIQEGIELQKVLEDFLKALYQTKIIAGHNIIGYDIPVVTAEFLRYGISDNFLKDKIYVDTCTSKEVIEFCQLPGGKGGGLKQPKLEELYEKLVGEKFQLAHNAAFDVQANAFAFFQLLKKQIIRIPEIKIDIDSIQYEAPDLSELYNNEKSFHQKKSSDTINSENSPSATTNIPFHFSYLHNHTTYSIGNSSTKIKQLIQKAAEYQANALAITDLGYMSGVIDFYTILKDVNKTIKNNNEKFAAEGKKTIPLIKPIIGCEFYLCEDINKQNQKYQNFQIPILAKNEKGYANLCKLSSISFIDGFYYVPRIDKKNLLENKEGLIILSGWIYGEIPQCLLNDGEQKAEEMILWYKEHFGDNFYLELNNHFLEEEKYINAFLIKMSEKYQIKAVAAQNNFYLKQEDADAYDTLLCIRNGEEKNKPIGKGSGKRFGMPNNEFYFKSPQQIKELFSFYPEAINNAIALAESIEIYPVEKDVVLPKFDIPETFAQQFQNLSEKELENEYLKHLAYKGAERKYKTLTDEIKNRIDFELETIKQMGFPGYFLIVSDILYEARKRGIRIGPGRGSAAGSIIAYVLDITNVDPIRYHLLFERFLNPERVSMPDIDIDIADDRRDEVIDYIVKKYGREKVANIITFSELGGKSAIRDAARTLGLQPDEVDKLAKAYNLLDELNIPIDALLNPDSIDFSKYISESDNLQNFKNTFKKAYDNYVQTHEKSIEVLEQSAKLTGCFRHTGIHACGLIIAPKRLDEISPLAKDSKSGQVITQLDVSVAEKAGLLKMDFLGLTTLSIITNALEYIKENKGVDVDIDNIPLNDEATFEIFRNGYTDEIFQFESPGMKKYLQQLKPDNINDLIAMNALYRPGPMKYIDSYIKRKHGIEKIEYPFPEMEEYLKETYGITVYQEQVMLLSQKLAGFTKGQADELRKAMGKKKLDVLQKMEQQFFDGCKKNGFDLNIIKKIWEDWKDFASYAFNKSHSVCYAVLAYQTAYLKAHFPAEFMCAALNTKGTVDDIAKVLNECNRMQIKILPPDINESVEKFKVLKDNSIRFGLSYIKNVGKGFAEELIESRKGKDKITNIFQLSERLSNKVINKKNIENLAQAGVFDSLKGIHRAMFFIPAKDGLTLTEKLSKYTESIQKKQTMGASLFDVSGSNIPQYPEIYNVPEWDITTKLLKEKEVLGLFISGNPLEEYKLLIQTIQPTSIKILQTDIQENLINYKNKTIQIVGWNSKVEQRTGKNGKPYYLITIEDESGSINLYINDDIAEKSQLKYQFNNIKPYLITGKIENRNFTNDSANDRWEFRVHEITLLEEVLKTKAELKVLIDIKNLHLDLIKDLMKMTTTNGKPFVPITLIINDEESNTHISTSNKMKINFDEENFNLLNQHKVKYKLILSQK